MKEREMGPRFAPPGSFEFEYGQSWKALYELDRQKKEALDAEMRYEKEKLEEQMEYAKFEHETTLLREQLRVLPFEFRLFNCCLRNILLSTCRLCVDVRCGDEQQEKSPLEVFDRHGEWPLVGVAGGGRD